MANKKEIKEYYKDLPKEKRIYAEKLIDELIFMGQTLARLRTTIRKEGAVIKTINGNGFEVTQEHPAQKSYNTTVKNYNSTLKLLTDMLPEGIGETGDEFTRFLSGE